MQFKPFKIGKYLLLERLATGGMAEVYRAKASGASGFEKQLAVKRIIPTYSESDEFRRMFEYEARLSSQLNHANIVHVYDFVNAGNTFLLAMEFVDGKNLRQVVNKAKKANFAVPIEFGVYVINEVCKGLHYAHKLKDSYHGKPLNVIHRDMSPQNVMLSYDGAIKIVDFGIAKAKDRVDETRSGVIKGKFGYMSPEQASGEDIDKRSDIFSTVIILYELITNKRLFASENDMATLKRIQECIVQRPSLSNPKVNSALEKIILKGLTKDRSLRYQDAGDLHQNLQEYLNKYHPRYTDKNVQKVMEVLFEKDIEEEKKRLEQVYKQSIPFSQQAEESEEDLGSIEKQLDGDETKSEHQPDSLVTKVTEPSIQELKKKNEKELPPPAMNTTSHTIGTSQSNLKPLPDPTKAKEPSQLGKMGASQSKSFNTYIGNEQTNPTTLNPSLTKGGKTDAHSVTDAKTKQTPALENIEGDTQPGSGERTMASDLFDDTQNTNAGTASKTEVGKPKPHPHDEVQLTLETNHNAPADTTNPNTNIDRVGSLSRGMSTPTPTAPAKRYHVPKRRARRSDLDYGVNPGNGIIAKFVRLVTSAIVLLALGGTLYYYFSIEDPTARKGSSRGTTTINPLKQKDKPTTIRKRTAKHNCAKKVDSDPRGASIFVDGELAGKTPGVVFVSCDRSSRVELKLSGYDEVSAVLSTKQQKEPLYRTLKRIPLGQVELTLSHNAQIYIDGKLHDTDARAGVPIRIPLRAGVTHNLRMVNKTLGMSTSKSFKVRKNELTRARLRLKSSRKPAKN